MAVSDVFNDGSRALQDRFDTRRIADRIDEKLVHNVISDDDKAFIEQRDMFFIATTDGEGRTNCSYKGGAPGFVRVVGENSIAFPSYDGNGMYLSMGNILKNPNVGLLFIDFERGHRLRLNGEATIDDEDPLMNDFPEAQFIVRVRASHVFPNCPRYIHRYELVGRSTFVPKRDRPTPVPEWKLADWAKDALPSGDPARAPGEREVRGR